MKRGPWLVGGQRFRDEILTSYVWIIVNRYKDRGLIVNHYKDYVGIKVNLVVNGMIGMNSEWFLI